MKLLADYYNHYSKKTSRQIAVNRSCDFSSGGVGLVQIAAYPSSIGLHLSDCKTNRPDDASLGRNAIQGRFLTVFRYQGLVWLAGLAEWWRARRGSRLDPSEPHVPSVCVPGSRNAVQHSRDRGFARSYIADYVLLPLPLYARAPPPHPHPSYQAPLRSHET